jgi:N6-adenosine-specific RNA methylase IME4
VTDWGGVSPPYATITADPPWAYDEGWPLFNDRKGVEHTRRLLDYSTMSVSDIAEMTVGEVAASDAHLYLWTTNRYLRDAYRVAEAWGFRFAQMLVWCKPPQGIGPGGAFSNTTEYCLFARRGTLAAKERVGSTWWNWPRGAHSVKPAAFYDLVEKVSPGPYIELFARAPRLGWDSYGLGVEAHVPR